MATATRRPGVGNALSPARRTTAPKSKTLTPEQFFSTLTDPNAEKALADQLSPEDLAKFQAYSAARAAAGLHYFPISSWLSANKPSKPGVTVQVTPGTPGTPGREPGKPVDPFLTPMESYDFFNKGQDITSQLAELDANYANAAADAKLAGINIEKNRARAAENTTDAMIGRGLFRSSVREHELNDIDAAASERQLQLTTNLARLAAANDRIRTDLAKRAEALGTLSSQQAVANAQAMPVDPGEAGTPGTGPTYTEVPKAQAPAPADPSAPQVQSQSAQPGGADAPKNVVKNGKFYHVYNYGKPNERWVYIRPASGGS